MAYKKRWGATPQEWAAVLDNPELAPRVLPVVCNPNVPISPSSSIRTHGKLPSVLNNDSELVGIAGWTTKETTDSERRAWSRRVDYGYCVRTGDGLVAIDCDVDDATLSAAILELLASSAGCASIFIPTRTRENSARWAALVKLTGGESIGKRRYVLDGGDALEILGKGQQLVCAGTHKSGARLEWFSGCDRTDAARFVNTFDMTLEQLNNFCESVAMLYGAADTADTVESVTARNKGETFKAYDPLAAWLRDTGRVLSEGAEGELFIRCPWEAEHSDGDNGSATGTAYFPIGSNGYQGGGFKCLHAHCAGRGLKEFAAWARAEGYTTTETGDYPVEETPEPKEDDRFKPELARRALLPYTNEKSGYIEACMASLTIALDYPAACGYEVGFDTFSGGIMLRELGKEGADGWRPYQDPDLVAIRCNLEAFGFSRGKGKPTKQDTRDALGYIAELRKFDYMRDFMAEAIPEWDGVQRCRNFFTKYCGAEASEYTHAVGVYLWTALWGRANSPEGIKADIAPVLVGAQGAGKSTLVEVLAIRPDWYTTVTFDKRDDDNARAIRGRLTAELPELAGMARREVADLKAFLGLTRDTWVQKYQEAATTAARRCVFIMSTNDKNFLTDTTGNRRYAPVDVGTVDLDAIRRDLLQLWAEGRELFKVHGVAQKAVEKANAAVLEAHMATDPWEEPLAQWLKGQEELPEAERYQVTTANLFSYALGLSVGHLEAGKQRRLASVMRSLGYTQHVVRRGGRVLRVWEPVV